MTDTTTVVEGPVKYRDGKKWKSRWCVVRKLSPVADCLNLQLFRDSKDKYKQGQTKANLSLEGYLGIESGFTLDKESHTLAILCQDVTVILAFDSREILIQWQVKIRTNLGEEHQYHIQIALAPSKSKIVSGPARLHIQDRMFCLVSGLPPRLLLCWNIQELRKYGVVDGKFCFEGGSRCGKGEGLHVIISNQAEEITATFELASQGKLQNKKKTGLSKNLVKDGILRKSHPISSYPSENKTIQMCSAESTRPLLNSSDSSICDTCSEIIRASGEYWPSAESHNLGSMDTLSVTVSEAGNGNLIHNWIPEQGSYLVDRVALLEKCSDRSLLSPRSSTTENIDLVTNGMIDGLSNENKMADVLSLSSQGSSSSASEYSVPRAYVESYYDKPKNIITAVDSCIHSSCSSNKPDFHVHPHEHDNSGLHTKQAGKVKSSIFPTNILAKESQKITSLDSASCIDAQNKDNITSSIPSSLSTPSNCNCSFLPMRDNPAYVRTPSSNNTTPIGSPKKFVHQINCPGNSLPTSPTKTCSNSNICLMSPTSKNVLKSTSSGSVITNSSLCSCSNPYGNYAVPRTSLASVHTKELQQNSNVTQSKSHHSNRIAFTSDSSDYDVPRRIKECLVPFERKDAYSLHTGFNPVSQGSTRPSGVSLKTCTCAPYITSSCYVTPICPCQRVFNWAEHLIPCRRRRNCDENSSHCFHQHLQNYVPCIQANCNQSLLSSCSISTTYTSHLSDSFDSYVLPTMCNTNITLPCTTQPTADPHKIISWEKSHPPKPNNNKPDPFSQDTPNYANMTYVTKNTAVNNSQQTSHSDTSNYVNLEFVESFKFYENASIIAKVAHANSDERVQESIKESKLDPSSDSAEKDSKIGGILPETTSVASEGDTRCKNCGHHIIKTIPELFHTEDTSVSETKSSSNMENNYLIMQPVAGKCLSSISPVQSLIRDPKNPKEVDTPFISKCSDYVAKAVISKDKKLLPIRPFMPLQLPLKYKDQHKIDTGIHHSQSASNDLEESTIKKSFLCRSMSLESRTVRSNSVVELKKRAFLRKRSSSADSRQDICSTYFADECLKILASSQETSCSPKDINSNCNKNQTNKNESLLSTSSSQSCSPKNHSVENLNKSSCNFDSLNNDVMLRNTNVNYHNSDSPKIIKRSSSVPCNPNNRDSASSSDSGVSAGSPKQIGTFSSSGEGIYMEMATIRANAGIAACKVEQNNIAFHHHHHQDVLCRNAPSENDPPVWLKRQDLKDGNSSPNQEIVNQQYYVDSKSTSSTTSDMSDYFETLSLSSHESNDMARFEDLSRSTHSNTSTLRPRSGREYQMLDRTLLEDCIMQPECGFMTVPTTCNGKFCSSDKVKNKYHENVLSANHFIVQSSGNTTSSEETKNETNSAETHQQK